MIETPPARKTPFQNLHLMKRINLPICFLVTTAVAVLFVPRISTAQTNIIQVVADDLGWTDLSTGLTNLGNGSPYYQTPNIDSLAANGMSFTSFYAQPSCAPTRAALLTGQYAPRNGLHTVGQLNDGGDATLLIGPTDGTSIKTEAITIGETLQAAGYVTAHIGKFHSTARSNDIVNEHGFDFNIGGTSSGGPNGTVPYFAQQNNGGNWTFGSSHGPELDVYAAPYTQQYIEANLMPYANGNDPSTLAGTPKHLNDAMADAAIDFLEDRVADGEPFFVNVAFNAVHLEVNSRPDLEAKFNALPTSNVPQHDSPAFAGLLEGMDQAVGRIVDFVQQNGLGNDTLIVFMSDNGGTLNSTDNFPLREGKGAFQEGGIRVPMIAYMPGTISSGVSNEATHAVDFYKTYAAMANATLPDSAMHPLDGESLAGILTGTQTDLNRDTIFYHFPGYNRTKPPISLAIHDGTDGNRYKLTYFYEDRNFEFYDLTNDIGETVNLVESGMTQIQFENAMAARSSLTDWLLDVDAEMLTVRATGEVVPLPQHSPAIEFALGSTEIGAQLTGTTEGMVSSLGVSMNLTAEGDNGVFDTDTNGIGIRSDLDTGGNNTQRRIDGSLTTPEGMIVSFDQDVFLKHFDVSGLNGTGTATESLRLQFVSGDNPFDGLVGYDSDGYALSGDALTFTRTDEANATLTVGMGRLAQDEILLTAGTQIRVTASPAVGGGVLLEAIGVALPDSPTALLGDVNRDGFVNFLDISPFISRLSNGEFQLEADVNQDGDVNFLDISPFIGILAG